MSDSPSIFRKTLRLPYALLFDRQYYWTLAALVVVGDALLTGLIIKFVPYTEIDWETYMVQVKVFLGGEHNYSRITGPTGPLVYPAGHVRIHQFLYDITNGGQNVALAQYIYGVLYLASLVLTCTIYRSAGNLPNWILLLLPLSKRLHSIFVLRLFNDCWAVVATQIAILLLQSGLYDTGVIFFSVALSIKMSVLLYLPGLLVILFKRTGLTGTLSHLFTMAALQTMFAVPFLREDAWAYAQSAFNFGRAFLYKWTVNWRMFDEETFLSKELSIALLVGHLSVLGAFGVWKWCEPDGGVYAVISSGLRFPSIPASPASVTPDYIATVLFTSNLIGMVFARSLHYQFYSWYAQQIPFLAFRTRYPLLVKLAIMLGIEYAWNIFPSTPLSSSVLLGCNALLLAGIWFGYPYGRKAVI